MTPLGENTYWVGSNILTSHWALTNQECERRFCDLRCVHRQRCIVDG